MANLGAGDGTCAQDIVRQDNLERGFLGYADPANCMVRKGCPAGSSKQTTEPARSYRSNRCKMNTQIMPAASFWETPLRRLSPDESFALADQMQLQGSQKPKAFAALNWLMSIGWRFRPQAEDTAEFCLKETLSTSLRWKRCL